MDINKSALGLVMTVGLAAGAAGALMVRQLPTMVGQTPTIDSSEGVLSASTPQLNQSETDNSRVDATAPGRIAVPHPPTRAGEPPVRRPQPATQPTQMAAPPETPADQASLATVSESSRGGQEAAVSDTPVQPLEPIAAPQPEPAAPSAPQFEDLVLTAGSVIGLQIERSVSSETARVEDEVVARVTRDVRVGDRVAIPAGSRVTGVVTLVERGGRLHEQARLGLRFTRVALADGTRVPIETEPIVREGDSPRKESAAKIGGGAIGGAILGGILGGAKGAAIGGSIGAGAGSAAVMTGGRNAATLPSGSPITVRLEREAAVTIER